MWKNQPGMAAKLNFDTVLKTERQQCSHKYIKRAERKFYDRLSVDSDDIITLQTKINKLSSSDEDLHANKMKKSKTFQITRNFQDDILENEKEFNLDFNWNNGIKVKDTNKQNELQNPNENIFKKELNNKSNEPKALLDNNENYIDRLQPVTAISEEEDYDEALICNVCDSEFDFVSQLASHQQKKRHFGCNECDSLFTSLNLLEHHKDNFEHWSAYDLNQTACCRKNRIDDFGDTDSFISEAASEDLERLL